MAHLVKKEKIYFYQHLSEKRAEVGIAEVACNFYELFMYR